MANTRALLAGFALLTCTAGCTQSEQEGETPWGKSGPSEDPHPQMRPTRPAPWRLKLLQADRPPPPISGGTLALTSDGATAVAADPDRDAVHVVNLAEDRSSTVALPAGSEPGRAVLDGAGYAHVALRSAGKVARISLAGPVLEQETEVCKHPRGLAYDAAGDAIWVACASGELVSLAAKTHAELTRRTVALDLRDVIVTSSGERFVSRYRSAELLRIQSDGTIATTSRPKTTFGISGIGRPVTRSPTLAWRTVAGINGTSMMLHQQSQLEPVSVGQGGYGGFGGCTSITQASLTRYDEQGMPISTAPVNSPALAVDVAVDPSGKTVAVAAPGAYLDGLRGTLQVLPLAAVEFSAVSEFPIPPVGGRPPSPDAGASFSGARPAPVGIAPSDAGLPPSPFNCGARGHDHNLDAQATSVAFDAKGLLYVLSREPARLTVLEQQAQDGVIYAPVKRIELDARSVRDTGHELFHADVGSGLSCASCHGEGTDDAHVWSFEGFGPRRTQNMRGGLLSTLPLHWEGDMPTFQHLVDEVMTGRMGGFAVAPEYAAALATWIDAQPELKLDASDPAASARGKQLFESPEVACATCHSGPQLTNNQTVDVGTGGEFQVPSLLGLGLRGPYMHDGCAEKLTQRFDTGCGGGDRHGKTSQLSPEQIADLVAYLETL